MARHRSPQGRRTHLGLPLPPVAAAAGAGGGDPVLELAPRVLATLVAGGALAAAGHAALTAALPTVTDGATSLTRGVQDLVGGATTGAPAPPAAAGLTLVADTRLSSSSPTIGALAPEPRVADVSDLVKAADLHSRATADATRREAADRAAAAEASPPAEAIAEADEPDEVRPPAPDEPADRAEQAPADLPTGEVRLVAGEVTSGFGARWGARHNGLDIAAPIGTPIHAPLAGDVVDSGPASGFGLWVRVRHDDGTVTTYGHVNRALAQVGDRVVAGQEIAEVGNRGRSTGPHLHMEVQTPGGTTVNPRPWLDGHGIAY